MVTKGKTFVVALKDISIKGKKVVFKNEVGVKLPGSKSIFFVRPWKKVTLSPNDYKVINVLKTGDQFPKKVCNICHKLIDTDSFARNQNSITRSVRRPSCQECRKTLEGKHPSQAEIKSWSKNNPKPNLEPFECPICGKRTIAGVTAKLVLDHEHQTGKIRGWICDSCNTGIGRFQDDIQIMKRAIKFVE